MPPTQADIARWVAADESDTQEFKTRTSDLGAIGRTVCAFLNTRGGRVLCGVKPSGEVVGQDVTDATIRGIANVVGDIDPPAFPTIDRVPLSSGKEVIVVEVPVGNRRPYVFRGVPYRRVGSTTQEIDRGEYNRLLIEQLHASDRWELELEPAWTIADLDESEIMRTLEEGLRRGRMDDPGTRATDDVLRGLGLTKDGELTRAAVVLFGKEERFMPTFAQCLLRLARFRGTDRSEFLDNRQYVGNAFGLLQHAERFLREHNPVAGRVEAGAIERKDEPLYPPLALREALANAFCHRDYSLGGGAVSLAIYDDRLEVSSSGQLHFGLTPADLFVPHESLPWNPLIASVFYKRGIIESWGRGTLKMTELAEQAGLPRPEIEEIAGAVIVRFRPTFYLPPTRIGFDLSDRQRAILGALGGGSPTRVGELVAALGEGISRAGVQDDLRVLRSLGLVDLSGFGRGARWSIVSAPIATAGQASDVANEPASPGQAELFPPNPRE